MNNKFVRAEARVLLFDDGRNFYVSDCNNQEQVDYAVRTFGKPKFYMSNFKNWHELVAAKRNYEYMLGISGIEPSDSEDEWFWQKQLVDEAPWDAAAYAEEVRKANEFYATLPNYYAKHYLEILGRT